MTKEIYLTQNQVALVDDDMFDFLDYWNWIAKYDPKRGIYYAVRNRTINDPPKPWAYRMHRVIINCPSGFDVDHINRNTLDNRKENLRIATRTQNNGNKIKQSNNTTGYKGVSYNKKYRKYQAEIQYKKVRHILGYYDDVLEAAEAYRKAAAELFGEFARFE